MKVLGVIGIIFWVSTFLILTAEKSSAAVRLPCDSPTHLKVSFPQLFKHCGGCVYGVWSEKRYTGVLKTNTTCPTNKARQFNRTRSARGSNCPDTVEITYECEPSISGTAKLMITALRLGADAGGGAKSGNTTSRLGRQVHGYCPSPSKQQYNRICPNMCPRRGKRLAEDINEAIDSAIEPMTPSVPVQQFDMDKHLSQIAHSTRVRRQPCGKTRFVLIILDTSGSIGSKDFNLAKKVIADISESLCGYLKVAMITYSTDINLEFCFNCNNNNRRDIKNAILRARYRGGSTHTTDAIKCACEEILTSQCGLPQFGIYSSNIDVLFLTDGRPNGPCRNNLNNELRCLHGKSNINTFGIGIGSHDHESIVKLTKGNGNHIFRVNNFKELTSVLQAINLLLAERLPDGKPLYSCAGHLGFCHG